MEMMFTYSLACIFLISQSFISLAYATLPAFTIAKEASQSVVFIAIESNPFELSYGQGQDYYFPLRPIYDCIWPSQYSHGSGFIISDDGYIVTNAHVVQNATKVSVVMQLGKTRIYQASVVGKDERTDIAVLKIPTPMDFAPPCLRFGDSNHIQVGDPIICIENPISVQLETSVTTGVISGIDRNHFGIHSIEGYIQIDAAINHGNSGGPLLNTQGEAIGVTSWIYRHDLGYEGLSFAIPSYIAQNIVEQIIAYGEPKQGFLGVGLSVDGETASIFDLYHFDHNEGACINKIIKDSPAERAGLEKGDFIFMVDQFPIQSAKSLRNRIAILAPKTRVKLMVDRQGTIINVSLELGSDELSNAYSQLEGASIVI